MKTILISTSKFGNPVSDYYKELGNSFVKDGFNVVYIFDGLVKNLPSNKKNQYFFTWPSKRPTKLTDFIFLYKLIEKYKPILCISNFGSTNVVSIVSYLLKVKNRFNYIHTTSKAIFNDSKNKKITKLLMYRKQYIYKLNTCFLTNSEGTKNDAIKCFGVNKNKIIVLPLLLEDSKIKYSNKNQRRKELLIVGGLTPTKGHRNLINQFSNCIAKYPDFKLIIIGSGYLENNLKELVSKLNISKNVIFKGRLPNSKVKEAFSKSLISISSSLDEAYGLVNIEALREGTPIVCTKTAGSIDILKEGYNGEYFYYKNKNSLCESISRIIENWKQYSENSLATFENYYSIESKIKEHKERIVYLLR